jgi:hypothetical protein
MDTNSAVSAKTPGTKDDHGPAAPLRLDQQVVRWLRITRLAAPILWFSFAVIAVVFLWPTLQNLVERISKAGVGDYFLEFADAKLSNVRGLENQPISKKDREVLLRRFRELAGTLEGAMVLWVDDVHPMANASERPVLEAVGMTVYTARSTEEAVSWMRHARYDILITNLNRPGDPPEQCFSGPEPANAGCRLLKLVGGQASAPALIVYTSNTMFDPSLGTPPFAMGVATTPTQLFHLVLDAMARKQSLK